MKTLAKALLALVIAWYLTPLPVVGAGDPVRDALPPGATAIREVSIPNSSSDVAVSYKARGSYLAVYHVAGDAARQIWRHSVSITVAHIDAPPQAGVFRAWTEPSTAGQGVLFAFRVHDASVSSALDMHPHGTIHARESIAVTSDGFTLESPDSTHAGGVKYRTVSRFGWRSSGYTRLQQVTVPDYASGSYPRPNATVQTVNGNSVLLRLQVANTEAQRESGLMNIAHLDPDWGMIFVWGSPPVLESFWMQNTYIPLTVAFLAADGQVQEMQDMQALTTTFHTPAQPYWYAIEANLGYFSQHDIKVGDRFTLDLASQVRS